VSFVAIFLKEFLLLGAVFALAFVSYILATKPPERVGHKITSVGVSFAGDSYPWSSLTKFWFRNLSGEDILVVLTDKKFPSQLVMLLGDADRAQIKGILSDYLEYVAAPDEDWMEKSARWLSEKVGLD
jgi:hypothetical protein